MLSARVFAQDITIAPKLEVGDTFTLEVTHAREDSAQPARNATGTTSVAVRVVSSDATGLVVAWIPGELRLDKSQAQNPILQGVASALRGLELRLTLSREGEVSGLTNEADVLAQLQAATDAVTRGLLALVPAAERATMEQVFAQFLSPAILLGSATRDATTYFGMSGVSLPVGARVKADLEQPNPLGGDPLPSSIELRMESATAETAVLTATTTYDAAPLLRTTRAMLEQAGQKVRDEELATIALQVNDDGRYVFDRTSGLMREVVAHRRMAFGGNSRVERLEIRLVRGPVR